VLLPVDEEVNTIVEVNLLSQKFLFLDDLIEMKLYLLFLNPLRFEISYFMI
jgi:hypothetical protein